MTRFLMLSAFLAVLLAAAPGAEARKNPGNPLPPPTLVAAEILAPGAAECDGDETTTDDVCVSATFTKVCTALKYSVDLTKGFDTTDDGCDDTSVSDNTGVAAETCTGTLNCLGDTAECQTAVVPIGTNTLCVDDGDLDVDCSADDGDPADDGDVLVSYDSLSVKVKAMNPPKKGRNSISQSTEFSNVLTPDENDECVL